jgi:hypothetical protein
MPTSTELVARAVERFKQLGYVPYSLQCALTAFGIDTDKLETNIIEGKFEHDHHVNH